MTVAVKVCGLSTHEAVHAAVTGGARWIGFVFYARSPRAVSADAAAALCATVPAGIERVGLFVDADDDAIAAVTSLTPLSLLQFHGRETPERVAAARRRFGLGIIKAVAVGEAADLDAAAPYESVADALLFDARPPAGADRPGGNARPFDWHLLAGRRWQRPWLLAGGLTADNLATAVAASGAVAVDVSSGVESAPGVKDPDRIASFLAVARQL